MNLDELARVNLNDSSQFAKVLDLEVPWAYAWADERDRDRREQYRKAAAQAEIIRPASDPLWWAFRITVEKSGRLLDVDNIAKLFTDAFCGEQIRDDHSLYDEKELALYDSDTLDHVRVLQRAGAPGAKDRTSNGPRRSESSSDSVGRC
jgi:hypothetical protein